MTTPYVPGIWMLWDPMIQYLGLEKCEKQEYYAESSWAYADYCTKADY